MTEPKIFDVKEYIRSQDLSFLSEDEQVQVARIRTLEDCQTFIDRHKGSPRRRFLKLLRQIKAGFEGYLNTDFNDIEWSCYEVLCNYEEVRRRIEKKKRQYTATRLRKSGRILSWKTILERTVSKPLKEETLGFKVLREGSRLDASFEVFILRNPESFSDKAVASSYKRLVQHGWSLSVVEK